MLRVFACGVACLLAVAVAAPAAARPPARHLRSDGRVLLAWLHDGTSADYRTQVASMTGVTVVSPTWWRLDRREPGALRDSADPGFVSWAHDRGLAVWPLLGNRFDPDLTDAALRAPDRRARLVAATVSAVQRAGADGVNVDFENLRDDTAPLLTAFVAELQAALGDRIVSVDVTAMTDSWVLDNWSTAFDRPGLGAASDYVVLMAYDQHNRLRRNGPVAGLSWVSDSLGFLLRSVPAHKVVLGVPLYSRDWVDDRAEPGGVGLHATLGMAEMSQRLAADGATATLDVAAGQRLFTYLDGRGRNHRVWLEDTDSLARKAQLVVTHGLAGAAAWRAGFETPEAWRILDGTLAAPPPVAGQAAPSPAGPPSQAATASRRPRLHAPGGVAAALLAVVVAAHWARLAAARRTS